MISDDNQTGPHPFFDDKRAVHWYRQLAPALAQALQSKRRVFVCVGGQSCGGTRALVERTIWKDEIAEYLNSHFVSVAVSPGEDETVTQLSEKLAKREPTPLCLFLDATGRVVHSTVGGRPPAVFLNEMLEGSTRK